jgi:hypothetical protein
MEDLHPEAGVMADLLPEAAASGLPAVLLPAVTAVLLPAATAAR